MSPSVDLTLNDIPDWHRTLGAGVSSRGHTTYHHDRHVQCPSSEVEHEHVVLRYRLHQVALRVCSVRVCVLSVACCFFRRGRGFCGGFDLGKSRDRLEDRVLGLRGMMTRGQDASSRPQALQTRGQQPSAR